MHQWFWISRGIYMYMYKIYMKFKKTIEYKIMIMYILLHVCDLLKYNIASLLVRRTMQQISQGSSVASRCCFISFICI